MPVEQDKMNVLIVDDEKKACTNLRNILVEFVGTGVNIAGVANNTREAELLISELTPDAIFLDIEMPNENAFHFLERIAPFNFEVIFVTAYDEYAVKAFRLNAVDYILKPISIPELKNAVEKLQEKLKFKNVIARGNVSYADIANQVQNKVKQHKITIKGINCVEVIDFKDIYYIEAQSSYSRLVFLKGKEMKEMTLSSPLSDYEELLPADMFYRVHRSYLVNCTHIKRIENNSINQVTLKQDIKLPISRRRYTLLLEFLKSNDFDYE